MKKTVIFLLIASILMLSVSGCFGKFALTKSVYKWNDSLGEPLVETLVFWALNIIPVYYFAGLIDIVLLNLIEFWTGKNPLAMNDTDFDRTFISQGDSNFEIITTKNRYDVFDANNPDSHIALVYDEVSARWNLVTD